MSLKEGSVEAFQSNWSQRKEAQFNHWCPNKSPKNQIQLAFLSHFEVFNNLMKNSHSQGKKSLEVGCGRGSLSSHFASDNWDVHLLDASEKVIETAQSVFKQNGHPGNFYVGDARDLPFEDNTYDSVSSIGLLEHFEDVQKVMEEQWRVLKPKGWFFGYIVPEKPDNVQKYFRWVNWLLKKSYSFFCKKKSSSTPKKEDIYRSDFDSKHYLKNIEHLDIENLHVFGMYSLPMISHSPEFPFSLLHPKLEWLLTKIFQCTLKVRSLITGKHGWICSEKMGQAFLVAFQKK